MTTIEHDARLQINIQRATKKFAKSVKLFKERTLFSTNFISVQDNM